MKTAPLHFKLSLWIHNPQRLPLLRWSGNFFILMSLIALVLGLQYLLRYSFPGEPLGIFYTIAAFVSHVALLSFVPWIVVVVPLCCLIPVRKIIVTVSVIAASALLSMLLLDGLVFGENRFHVNVLTMKILGWKSWGFGIVYFVIFTAFNSLLAKWLLQRRTGLPGRFSGGIVFCLVVILTLTAQGLHMWADANYYSPITRFTTYLPVYYPVTARRLLEKKGFVDTTKLREKNRISTRSSDQTLCYPRKPLEYIQPDTLRNVMVIIIDAMRADMLTPARSPALWQFAQRSLVFMNHYSGGNSSRMGMFSLFYALPSTYWQYCESVQYPPLLMDKLQQCGYQIGIFSGGPLNRPTSLDRTAFCRIKDLRIITKASKNASYARDAQIVTDWTGWLDTRDTAKPFFGFLYFESPSCRSMPPEYEKVLDYPAEASDMQKRFVKYTASIRYIDSLAAIVLGDLQKRGLLENTCIIITSDHGEEFNESEMGYKGHGSSYSAAQLHIPLIVYWPGKVPAIITKRTSHLDIAPTIIEDLLGCTNPPQDYCSGNPLFSDKQWDWVITGSYYNYAVLEPTQVTVVYPGGYFEVRDADYRVRSSRELNKDVITQAFNETKKFFK